MQQATNVYANAFWAGLRPERPLSVSEWADTHRFLSPRASSEPGRWRTARTPYLREIMDALSTHSPVEMVVFMKGAQVGGTECGNNWVGYIMDEAPGPMLAVQPTVEMAKRVSKQRLAPLIQDSPRLREKVKEPRSRDSGNTVLTKEFPAGVLILTGANSAVGLRSMPVRYLFLDEVDGYPEDADGEGEPVDLAIGRTRTFSRRKILLTSTPTLSGRSRIERAFLESDQRYYHVPCPFCHAYQPLVWSQLRWEKEQPDTVHYVCADCSEKIDERYKTSLLEQGKWVAQSPENENKNNKIRGYHLSALYSPLGWFSWADAVRLWEKSHQNPVTLRVFVNTVLGETWQDKGEAPDWRRLYEQREPYRIGTVPLPVVILTAGIDVQRDRIECSIIGWSRQQAWLIDHVVLMGETTQNQVWEALTALLATGWKHESGNELTLSRAAIDTGYQTNTVYAWVREQQPNQVMAIKGQDALQAPVGQPKSVDVNRRGKRIARGIKVWPVGVSVLKTEIYGRLKLKKPTEEEFKQSGFPATFIHFPLFAEEYFKQLTAEQLMVRLVRGYRKYQWEKLYERNEALDCLVYSFAAYYAAGLHRLSEKEWQSLEDQLYTPIGSSTSLKNNNKQNRTKKEITIVRKKSSFW